MVVMFQIKAVKETDGKCSAVFDSPCRVEETCSDAAAKIWGSYRISSLPLLFLSPPYVSPASPPTLASARSALRRIASMGFAVVWEVGLVCV